MTLNAIPSDYADIDTNWLEQNMPESLKTTKTLGNPVRAMPYWATA